MRFLSLTTINILNNRTSIEEFCKELKKKCMASALNTESSHKIEEFLPHLIHPMGHEGKETGNGTGPWSAQGTQGKCKETFYLDK